MLSAPYTITYFISIGGLKAPADTDADADADADADTDADITLYFTSVRGRRPLTVTVRDSRT